MAFRSHVPRASWRAATIVVAMAYTALVAACSDPAAPGTPLDANRTPTAGALRAAPAGGPHFAPNTASDELAQAVPGFGGAFVSNGALNIYLTADANTAAGQAAARTAVASLFATGHRPMMPLVFHTAQHSFKQLRAWETALSAMYARIGVRTAQVDERTNGFKISVVNSSAVRALQSALISLGIPTGIVQSEVQSAPVVPFVDLGNKVRPAGGGLYILTMFSYGGVPYRYGCTYGFNAQIDDGSGTRYMVTNAHCVQPEGTFGGLIGATVAQPDSNQTSLVGLVSSNPAAQAGITGCAAGDSCRESDAVLVTTDQTYFPATSWDIGGIEATTSRGVGPNSGGSTTISGRIALADASTTFFAGDTLEKIGSTTGWTAGVVTGTCVYHSDGAGGGRMCNGVVAAGANHGDSGSPVFWKDGSGNYHLMGILWGGPDGYAGHNSSEFWFSRWQSIKDDLSPYNNLLVTPADSGYSCVPKPGQQCGV